MGMGRRKKGAKKKNSGGGSKSDPAKSSGGGNKCDPASGSTSKPAKSSGGGSKSDPASCSTSNPGKSSGGGTSNPAASGSVNNPAASRSSNAALLLYDDPDHKEPFLIPIPTLPEKTLYLRMRIINKALCMIFTIVSLTPQIDKELFKDLAKHFTRKFRADRESVTKEEYVIWAFNMGLPFMKNNKSLAGTNIYLRIWIQLGWYVGVRRWRSASSLWRKHGDVDARSP
ncbi:hypothetical protein SELMODRAFT_430756 [Selaginella moellendorffii]|uniref:Uncharacterized protein n=1 Tax=Selaginella moellendorffii TaxID=88036 RepID=D8TAE9_SELML|nr:hypothetical protein SELMODRAFT_430756 [Selaginella moellendorffii]